MRIKYFKIETTSFLVDPEKLFEYKDKSKRKSVCHSDINKLYAG